MPIDMLFRPLFLLLLVAQLGGCLRDEAAICAEKISKVEYSRRQAHADLFRARAECQAQAIEFSARDMNDNCQQTNQIDDAEFRSKVDDQQAKKRELAQKLMDASGAYEMVTNFSADHQEALNAFVQKRAPKFTGR